MPQVLKTLGTCTPFRKTVPEMCLCYKVSQMWFQMKIPHESCSECLKPQGDFKSRLKQLSYDKLMNRHWSVIPKTDIFTLTDETLVSTRGCGVRKRQCAVTCHTGRSNYNGCPLITSLVSRVVIVNFGIILVASKISKLLKLF